MCQRQTWQQNNLDGVCFLSIDGIAIAFCKVSAREKAQQMFEMIVYTVPFDIIRKCRSEL